MDNRPVIEAHCVVRTDTDVRQLHIPQNSLGVDQYGQPEQYLLYFVADAGSDDHPDYIRLTATGLLKRRANGDMYDPPLKAKLHRLYRRVRLHHADHWSASAVALGLVHKLLKLLRNPSHQQFPFSCRAAFPDPSKGLIANMRSKALRRTEDVELNTRRARLWLTGIHHVSDHSFLIFHALGPVVGVLLAGYKAQTGNISFDLSGMAE
jgi:hypothetical protein